MNGSAYCREQCKLFIFFYIFISTIWSKTNTEMLRMLYFELEVFPLSEYWTVKHIQMRSCSHIYPFVSSPHCYNYGKCAHEYRLKIVRSSKNGSKYHSSARTLGGLCVIFWNNGEYLEFERKTRRKSAMVLSDENVRDNLTSPTTECTNCHCNSIQQKEFERM